jgi:hypothetical protein
LSTTQRRPPTVRTAKPEDSGRTSRAPIRSRGDTRANIPRLNF